MIEVTNIGRHCTSEPFHGPESSFALFYIVWYALQTFAALHIISLRKAIGSKFPLNARRVLSAMSLKNLKCSTPYPWSTLSSTRSAFRSMTKISKITGATTGLKRSLQNGHVSTLLATIRYLVVYTAMGAKFVNIRRWSVFSSTYHYFDLVASDALGSSLLRSKRSSCSKGKPWTRFGVISYGGWICCWAAGGQIVTLMAILSRVLSCLERGKRLSQERPLQSQSWGVTGCGWSNAYPLDHRGKEVCMYPSASCARLVQTNPSFTTTYKRIPMYGTRSTPLLLISWWCKCLNNQATRRRIHMHVHLYRLVQCIIRLICQCIYTCVTFDIVCLGWWSWAEQRAHLRSTHCPQRIQTRSDSVVQHACDQFRAAIWNKCERTVTRQKYF